MKVAFLAKFAKISAHENFRPHGILNRLISVEMMTLGILKMADDLTIQ